MRVLKLGEFCRTGSGGTPTRSKKEFYENGEIPWIKSGELNQPEVKESEEFITESGLNGSAAKLLEPDAILIAMYGATVGQVSRLRIKAATNQAICYIYPDKEICDENYLFSFVKASRNVLLNQRVGGGQPNISQQIVRDLKIPLPPLEEQKRIAKILDAADALRAKRRQAIAQLDTFLQSSFLDLFGDPVTNPKGWEEVRFEDVVGSTFRNGLSPSRKGTFKGEVLTLSAITRGWFEGSFCKSAIFEREPSANQLVCPNTFLICRGNGNKKLVGIGCFPDAEMNSVAFPDTMIGVNIEQNQITPMFLQHIWSSEKIRQQIESGARTTNGTYKVNQEILRNIIVPLPPLGLQQRFASIVESVEQQKSKMQAHLTQLDTLFSSLQQRAFKGEL